MKAYWQANLALIASLLSVWAFVSFGLSIFLAEPLSHMRIGSLPLSFWFAQQGSIFTFVVLILIYAWRMDALDRKYDVHE